MNHIKSNVQMGLPASGLEWNSQNGQLMEDENEPAVQARRAEAERMEELKANRFGEPTALEQAVSSNPNSSPAALAAAARVKVARERCAKAVIQGRMSSLESLETDIQMYARRLEEQLQMERNGDNYYGGKFEFVESSQLALRAEPQPRVESVATKEPSLVDRILDEVAARLKFTRAERELLSDGWNEAEILAKRVQDAETRAIMDAARTAEQARNDATLQEAVRQSRSDYVAPKKERAAH